MLPLLKILGKIDIIGDVPFAVVISALFGTFQKSLAASLKFSFNLSSGKHSHTHFGIFGIG